jgi:hypothetical protein
VIVVDVVVMVAIAVDAVVIVEAVAVIAVDVVAMVADVAAIAVDAVVIDVLPDANLPAQTPLSFPSFSTHTRSTTNSSLKHDGSGLLVVAGLCFLVVSLRVYLADHKSISWCQSER